MGAIKDFVDNVFDKKFLFFLNDTKLNVLEFSEKDSCSQIQVTNI